MTTDTLKNMSEDIIGKKQIKKPNTLIDAMYSSSLLENKLLALAFSKAQLKDGRMMSVISAQEIAKLLDMKDGSFVYKRLKAAAIEMTGRKLIIEDVIKKNFTIINLIGSASYVNAQLIIKFEPDLTEYITDLKANYTIFDIPILMSFSKNYSYRLYELLKSKAYTQNEIGPNKYSVSYDLSELKLLIGIVDTESEKVLRELRKPNPDFDKIVNIVSRDDNYSLWGNFRRSVLIPAIEEINEKTDLNVDFKTVKVGYGGKVSRIIFNFSKKEAVKFTSKINVTEDEFSEMIDELIAYFDIPLRVKDAQTLLKAANYNPEIIKKAYDLSQKREDIDNPVGWILTAIKNNFLSD